MNVLRWIIGIVSAVLVTGSAVSFALFIARDEDRWIKRARWLRQWAFTALLFWFNIEIWGRVIYTLVTWKR